MKSEQRIGDMKWRGRKPESERGHSVLFLMRWSSDISALRGCLLTGGATASGSWITSCSSASQGWMQTGWRWSTYLHRNPWKDKDRRDVQQNLITMCLLCLCVWGVMCVTAVEDLLSLLRASWWEVTWQTVPCDFSWDRQHSAQAPLQDPIKAQRMPFKSKRKLTFTHLRCTKVASATVTQ